MSEQQTCEHCDGTGVVARKSHFSKVSHFTCWACDGTGEARLVKKRVWNERGGFYETVWEKVDALGADDE